MKKHPLFSRSYVHTVHTVAVVLCTLYNIQRKKKHTGTHIQWHQHNGVQQQRAKRQEPKKIEWNFMKRTQNNLWPHKQIQQKRD